MIDEGFLASLRKPNPALAEALANIKLDTIRSLLEGGLYDDTLYFCCKCQQGHWHDSGVGKEHQSFKLTSAMYLEAQP
jgi:hypothetical protein